METKDWRYDGVRVVRSTALWGDRLEFTTDVGPGDFVYFAPRVPHQELNLSANEPVDFVVIRSDNSAIRIDLGVDPAEHSETVY